MGRIDVMINNAVIQFDESAMDTTIAQSAAKDMIRRG